MEIFNQKVNKIGDDSIFDIVEIFGLLVDKIEKPNFQSYILAPTEINRRFGGFGTFKNFERQHDNITLYKNLRLPYTGEAIYAKTVYRTKDGDNKIGTLIEIQIALEATNEILFSLKIQNQSVLGDVNFNYFLEWLENFIKKDEISFMNRNFIPQRKQNTSHNYFQELEDVEIRDRLQALFESNQSFFQISTPDNSLDGSKEIDDFSNDILSAGSLENFKAIQQRLFLTDKSFIIREDAKHIEKQDLIIFSMGICSPIKNFPKKKPSKTKNYFDQILDNFETSYEKNKTYSEQVKFIFNDFIWGRINTVLGQFTPKELHFIPAAKIATERIYLDFDSNKSIVSLKRLSDIIVRSSQYEDDILVPFFRSSLKVLGEDFDYQIESGSDQSSSLVFITTKGKKILLADAGFGISQYLNLLAQVIIASYSVYSKYQRSNVAHHMDLEEYIMEFKPEVPILLIEEPEAHLHPAFQSKLADMFIEAARTFNIQFIIETHSEYLIRKLQYLTAKGEIKPEDTAIYYFYPPDDGPPGEDQVKRIDILKDGRLSSPFGEGFYDESARLMIELMNIHVN